MSGSCLTLKRGVPICGLGTFRSTGKDVQVAVAAALDNGIRHIDTAAIYKVTPVVFHTAKLAGRHVNRCTV